MGHHISLGFKQAEENQDDHVLVKHQKWYRHNQPKKQSV